MGQGSCSLQRTAAVRMFCCLTEKTGLHQGSLEVKHNTHTRSQLVMMMVEGIEAVVMLVKKTTLMVLIDINALHFTELFNEFIPTALHWQANGFH